MPGLKVSNFSNTTELPDHLLWLLEDPLKVVNQEKLEMLRSGRDLYDLSMINPDLMPPRFLIDKLLEATVKSHNHRYAVSRGIRQLREAFVHLYREKFSSDFNAETEVCITMGSKEGLLSALTCLAGKGGGSKNVKVLLGKPSYPAHMSAVKVCGLQHDFFNISENEDQMLEEIRQLSSKLSGPSVLLLNFPNNPTGICVSGDFYIKLHSMLKTEDVFVINDFVYGEMGFGDRRVNSMLAAPGFLNTAVEIYSLSKAYSVPGWRVGALLGSSDLVGKVSRLKSHTDYGVFLPLQLAAAAALMSSNDLVSSTTRSYEKRCQLMRRGLDRSGWKVRSPEAGASIWAEIPGHLSGAGSLDFSRRLLRETGILVLPGVVFGREFDRYVRMAAVTTEERIHQALGRISEFSLCQ